MSGTGGSGDIYDYPFVGYGSYDEYNNLLKDKVDFDRFGSVVSFNDSESVLACVRRHLGIAVAPYIKVRQDVESGGNFVLFDDKYSADLPVSVLYDLEMDMNSYRRRFVELLLETRDRSF